MSLFTSIAYFFVLVNMVIYLKAYIKVCLCIYIKVKAGLPWPLKISRLLIRTCSKTRSGRPRSPESAFPPGEPSLVLKPDPVEPAGVYQGVQVFTHPGQLDPPVEPAAAGTIEEHKAL